MNLVQISRVRWCGVDHSGLLAFYYAHCRCFVNLSPCGNVVSLDLPSQTYCYVLGHAFSSEQLAAVTQQTLTRILQSCLRQLEERQRLLPQLPAGGTPDVEQAVILQEVIQQLWPWLGKV
jgi:hypothetical protein